MVSSVSSTSATPMIGLNPGANEVSRMSRRVSSHRMNHPMASAASTTDPTHMMNGWVSALSSVERRVKNMIRPSSSTNQQPTVTASAIRPSLREPAVIWAPPGMKRVSRVSTTARRLRSR